MEELETEEIGFPLVVISIGRGGALSPLNLCGVYVCELSVAERSMDIALRRLLSFVNCSSDELIGRRRGELHGTV